MDSSDHEDADECNSPGHREEAPIARLTDSGKRFEFREDWFVIAGESEVGPPESSLHLRNLLDAEDGGRHVRQRSLTQRIKASVKRKF